MSKQVIDKYCIRRIGTENELLTVYSAIDDNGKKSFYLSNLVEFPIWAVDSKEEAKRAIMVDTPYEVSTYEMPCHAEVITPENYEIVRQRVTIEVDKVIV